MRKEKFSPRTIKISAGLQPEARKTLFWKRILEILSSSSRRKKGVNISKIAAYVKEGGTAVVPDKVLGSGNLKAKFTVAALSFSASAKKAIEGAGGKAVSIMDVAKKNPTGKDVVIIK